MMLAVAAVLETAEQVAGAAAVPVADHTALHILHTEHNTGHNMLPMLQHCPGPVYCLNLQQSTNCCNNFHSLPWSHKLPLSALYCYLPQETLHTFDKICRRF